MEARWAFTGSRDGMRGRHNEPPDWGGGAHDARRTRMALTLRTAWAYVRLRERQTQRRDET